MFIVAAFTLCNSSVRGCVYLSRLILSNVECRKCVSVICRRAQTLITLCSAPLPAKAERYIGDLLFSIVRLESSSLCGAKC